MKFEQNVSMENMGQTTNAPNRMNPARGVITIVHQPNADDRGDN